MRAVIALVELRVQRVLPFQQPGRVRDPSEELGSRFRFPGMEQRIECVACRAEFFVRLASHRLSHTGIRRAPLGGENELPAGILLQHVVDHLRHRRLTHRCGVDSFVPPTDGRPERRAVGKDFSFALQRLERFPMLVL